MDVSGRAITYHADALRLIARRLNLPELRAIVRQPGISEAYRLTIYYHDGRHPDQVATLIRTQYDRVTLVTVYRRVRHQPALDYSLDPDRYRLFDLALRRLGFDRHDNQPDLPYSGADLWLLERASGSFAHSIVIAPEQATGVYARMVAAVRDHLPEAARAIPPD